MRELYQLVLFALAAIQAVAAPANTSAPDLARRIIVMIGPCNADQAGQWVCSKDHKWAAICPEGGGSTQAISVPPGDARCAPKYKSTTTVWQTMLSTERLQRSTSTKVVVVTPTVTAAPAAKVE
ncbi:hypothetical protein LTR70_010005 [Exophiala xenobiotica]|uniref:Uncharacterized protein n=1 Tax=Lithohypha guttulata TaxID=1690604 RepID=A0ABR0JVH2_9EURO|nr:hypothetical protein LTR24_009928 [Lithohypha guttulata]KAK5309759.1 hypothetical protein LTR70_010005 [Exophiala xenobiotica]